MTTYIKAPAGGSGAAPLDPPYSEDALAAEQKRRKQAEALAAYYLNIKEHVRSWAPLDKGHPRGKRSKMTKAAN